MMAATLDDIAHEIAVCTRCRLHETRTHAVPGEGDVQARVICIGEAPGRREDETGRPFMGPSGRFLEGMLAIAGLTREEVFITSVNKCHPPQNRTPRRDEIETCVVAHLHCQIAALEPEVMVLLGAAAVRGVLKRPVSPLSSLAGQVLDHEGRQAFVTYHPAAGMRFPNTGAAMREHFARLRRLLAKC